MRLRMGGGGGGYKKPDGYCYFSDYCEGVVYDYGCYAFKIHVGNVSNCTGVGVKSPDGFCASEVIRHAGAI